VLNFTIFWRIWTVCNGIRKPEFIALFFQAARAREADRVLKRRVAAVVEEGAIPPPRRGGNIF